MTALRTNPRALALLALAAFLAAAMLLAPDRGSAGESKRATAIKIGKTKSNPKPTCPTPNVDQPPADKVCQAMGRVTGFQTMADGRKNPFKVRKPGHIVAWSVALSRPNKKERQFFETQLSKSGPPSARLSILKPKGEDVFRLTKQSPVVQLRSELNSTPVYTLTDPLKVKKGMTVALTTPTWVSNLADFGASGSDSWRTSRERGQCTQTEDLLKRSRPQQKVGGKRNYSCDYRGARILYWAYFVPRRG